MASRTNTTAAPPRLIGAKRVPDEFGIKYGTLRDLVHRGEIPVVRVGKNWYFERRDLDAFIAANKTRVA